MLPQLNDALQAELREFTSRGMALLGGHADVVGGDACGGRNVRVRRQPSIVEAIRDDGLHRFSQSTMHGKLVHECRLWAKEEEMPGPAPTERARTSSGPSGLGRAGSATSPAGIPGVGAGDGAFPSIAAAGVRTHPMPSLPRGFQGSSSASAGTSSFSKVRRIRYLFCLYELELTSAPSLHHSAITRRPPLMLQFFSRTKSGQLARPLLAPTDDDDDDDDALAKELSPSASVRGGSADTGSARAPATAATAAGDAAAAAAAHGTAAVALPPRHHDAIVRSFAPGLFRALRKECVPVLFCSIPPQLSPTFCWTSRSLGLDQTRLKNKKRLFPYAMRIV